MAPVLAWLTRLDPFRTDAKLDPPLRQLADTAHTERGKRCSVVGTNGPGQSVLSKGSFKPRPNHPIAVLPQGLAHQQITREIVGQRKRVTALTIPQEKVSLEVRTPDLIRSMAVAKRFTVRCHVAPTHTAVDQPCTLEDRTGCRVRRPGQLRFFLTQIIQNLFRTPARMAKLDGNNHLADFLRGLIAMTVRRARALLERLNSTVLVALNPFVSRGTANSIGSAQFNLTVFFTQPVGDKFNSLIHGTGLFPRHWQAPPCLCLLNCKPCARFVL